MITEEEYKKAVEIVKAYQAQINEEVDKIIPKELPESIGDLYLSTRAFYTLLQVLKSYDFAPCELREGFHVITVKNIRSIRNAGMKTVMEVEDKFREYGIKIQ